MHPIVHVEPPQFTRTYIGYTATELGFAGQWLRASRPFTRAARLALTSVADRQ